MAKEKKVVPNYKKKLVFELRDLIEKNKTILIASIKNLPASQFQEIGKKLRGKAVIKVPKKRLISLAVDETKEENLKAIKEKLDDSFAVLFSNKDAYELAGELLKNKTPSKAKTGQIAPEDIEIPAGPTELTPGPAISELGALGIKIQIKEGKIHISEPRIVAKKGSAISKGACDIMSKLDIKPFSIGYIPLLAFDREAQILYSEININPEEAIKNLLNSYSKALPFAVNIGYSTKETIKFILQKAALHEKALEKLQTNASESPKEEVKKEEKSETSSNGEELNKQENNQ
jgi:large subunit ribosomal protein L10